MEKPFDDFLQIPLGWEWAKAREGDWVYDHGIRKWMYAEGGTWVLDRLYRVDRDMMEFAVDLAVKAGKQDRLSIGLIRGAIKAAAVHRAMAFNSRTAQGLPKPREKKERPQ